MPDQISCERPRLQIETPIVSSDLRSAHAAQPDPGRERSTPVIGEFDVVVLGWRVRRDWRRPPRRLALADPTISSNAMGFWAAPGTNPGQQFLWAARPGYWRGLRPRFVHGIIDDLQAADHHFQGWLRRIPGMAAKSGPRV